MSMPPTDPLSAAIERAVDRVLNAKLPELVAAVLSAQEQRPVYLDRRGLAEELGCCVDVVDRLRTEGLPTTWIGDTPKFALDEVRDFLRRRPPPKKRGKRQ